MLQKEIRASTRPLTNGSAARLLSEPTRYRHRSPRRAPAGRGSQAETIAAGIELLGPALLDGVASRVAALARGPRHCQAGDSRGLAPRRIPPVLALAIPISGWAAEDPGGNPGVGSPAIARGVF